MKKAIVFAILFLFGTAVAVGQEYTTVTANALQVDNGSGSLVYPPSGSNLCFLGVNNLGQPITYTPNGGSPVNGPVCGTLNATGGLTAGLQVANAALAQPSGLFYTVTIQNGGTTYLSIPLVTVQGSLFSMDSYALPSQGTALGVGFPHLGCNAGAQWTSNTLPLGQNAATCNSSGSWVGYPPNNYCPAGTAYLVPQQGGTPFCVSPLLAGGTAPSGLCTPNSFFFLSTSPGVLYGCYNGSWTAVAGGGATGLLSFNGRTASAATLQAIDLQGVLQNTPFSMTGSQGLIYDSAAGTPKPTANWVIGTGANLGQLYGYQNLNLAPSSGAAAQIILNSTTGAASFAGGSAQVTSAGVGQFAAGSTVNGSTICTPGNGACASTAGAYYQTVQNATVSVTQRAKLNLITSTGISAADNSANGSSDLSLVAIPNASLANSTITVNAGTGISGGGVVSLGGSLTLATSSLVPLTNIANSFTVSNAFAGITNSGSYTQTGSSLNTFTGETGVYATTAATSTQNYNSPSMVFVGTYWNGSASAQDTWSCADVPGPGSNPVSKLQCTQSGSGGVPTFYVPNLSTGAFDSHTGDIYGGHLILDQNTPATSTANQSSALFGIQAQYWNGSVTLGDQWNWQNVLGTGTNPTSTYTLSHGGTPGALAVSIPFTLSASSYQVNGVALAASNLSNGTTGTGSVVLGTNPTITSPTIATNFPNSAAVQHFTVTMCTVGTTQGASCSTTVTYPVAEPDTNYELSCMYVDGSLSAILTAYNTYQTQATLALYQTGTLGGSNYGIAQCILMHN